MRLVGKRFYAVFVAAALLSAVLIFAVMSFNAPEAHAATVEEKVVYISGSGMDGNDGASEGNAVKTFAKAKEILAGSNGRIVVAGQIHVLANEEWIAEEGQKIKVVRNRGFSSKMIAIHARATLYIKDIEISAMGIASATSDGYLIDMESSANGVGTLAVGGSVIVNDAPDGKNVHLPEKCHIKIRSPLTGGAGSICVKSDNGIGDTVFEHKIAEGVGYTITDTDAAAFKEFADTTHDNIINTEIKDNAVVFAVSPENRINLTLKEVSDDGILISEETRTVVKGSNKTNAFRFLAETDGIEGVPKNLTHVKSVTLNGGDNLIIHKTDGTPEENYNETGKITYPGFEWANDGWNYTFASAEENSVLEVTYAPDAFSVSFDARGGFGGFASYLVPYGARDPDLYGDASVSGFIPERSGFSYTGYASSDGEDYSAMPAHGITYVAGWRILDPDVAIVGADTVKIGEVIALSSTATVYGSLNYSYFWYKDGELVDGADERMLILTKVEQSGRYVLQIVASDPLLYAPTLSATSAAVSAIIERYGAGQGEQPDVPPTDVETDQPLPENAVLNIESLDRKNSNIKTPLGYRAVGRFFASLKADGKDVILKKNLTVKIKLEGKLLSDESLILVMIGKDGVPTSREFRIENGTLIFETDALGEFALFVKTAVPWWAWIVIACGVLIIAAVAAASIVYKKLYTLSFDTDGGTAVKNKYVLAGSRVPKLPTPEKNGSDFSGWYLDEEKTQAFDYKTMPKADMVLFAKWKPRFGGKNGSNA